MVILLALPISIPFEWGQSLLARFYRVIFPLLQKRFEKTPGIKNKDLVLRIFCPKRVLSRTLLEGEDIFILRLKSIFFFANKERKRSTF